MNDQLEQLIAQLCDADKRNASKELQKIAGLILIENVAEWYQEIITNA